VSHREHASVVGVPKLIPGYAGFQVEKEVANLSQAFNPQHPFLFILGGAKFDTKMPLLSRFDEIADKIFVGGALANDIFVAKGQEVGRSTVSSTKLDLSHFITDPKITLPVDVLLDDKRTILVGEVGPQDRIMDSGPQTLKNLQAEISKAKFILWNGPLGLYEDGYRGTTLDLAKSISEMTAKGTTTIVGGGDTLAAIASLGIGEDFTFVSTAGGAMLDYLAKGTLPGLEVLNG
jgi:phosphoglycerate kinase